ncbi:DUF2243 domain-containing protein [Pseudarthrobacter quantipunctorum]|uniref:DUF2243 domain-containing protein n=1 Tax=Pseudarthrobacter quantipunctorum TaxID=3128980 RepID=A0ABZ2RB22_9MICC
MDPGGCSGCARRPRPEAGKAFRELGFHTGLALAGWGIFNIIEGLVNHQLLQIHHVRDDLGGPPAWDLGFLGVSVLLVAAGWLLYRKGLGAGRRA